MESEEEKELTYALRKQVAQKRNENGRQWTFDELINNCKETGGRNVLNSQENKEDLPWLQKADKCIQKPPNKNWYWVSLRAILPRKEKMRIKMNIN